jgi:glycosyltransferase involved in cell wall biosynthesis
MRIIFIRHSILNRGGDWVTLEYAGHLAKKGHDVIIFVNYVNTAFKIPPLVKIKSLPLKSKLGTIAKAIFTKFPSDIIIADIIAMVAFLSFRNHRKLIYFAQDYDESYYSSKLMRWLIRTIYFYALKFRNIPVIAVSDNLANLLHLRFKTNVKVVFNGINFDEFYTEKDEALLYKKGNRQTILIFMRRDHRKGSDIALKILERIAKTELKDKIIIWTIGENTDIGGLSIKNFGFVKHDELRKILSSADIFLFPTRHEGLSLLILQAMACGCAVVTTTAVEFAHDMEDALVSRIGNAEQIFLKLKELLLNEELKHRLRKNALESVKSYDINKSKENFEKALVSLYTGRGG